MTINKPEDLRPGDRVGFPGFRDQDSARVKGEPLVRMATFTRMPPCRYECYEFLFDKGYIEHWGRFELTYALNGLEAPRVYAPGDLPLEAHVIELMNGRDHGRG